MDKEEFHFRSLIPLPINIVHGRRIRSIVLFINFQNRVGSLTFPKVTDKFKYRDLTEINILLSSSFSLMRAMILGKNGKVGGTALRQRQKKTLEF